MYWDEIFLLAQVLLYSGDNKLSKKLIINTEEKLYLWSYKDGSQVKKQFVSWSVLLYLYFWINLEF